MKMEKTKITEKQIMPNGVRENVVALSETSTMQKLGNGVLSCYELLAGYKEARVVLVDLKYSDCLTQQQRRELTPKRRKPSSVTSQRTRNLLKEIAKEEAVAWMEDWTDSSVESNKRFPSQNKTKQKRGRRTTQSSRKKNAALSKVFIKQEKDPENESIAAKKKKGKTSEGTKRRVGRPKKNVTKLEDPRKLSVMATSDSNSADAKIKVEEDGRLDLPDNVVKIENERDLRLNVMNSDVQRNGNLIKNQGRGKGTEKKTRKISKSNNLKNLFATFRGDEDSKCDGNEVKQSSFEIKQEMLSPSAAAKQELIGNDQLNVVSAQMKITNEPENTQSPLKLQISSIPKPVIKIFPNHESYDRIIEEVVAAGRSPIPFENDVEFRSEKFIKEIPGSSDNLREKKANHPLSSSGKELQTVGLDVLNMSMDSSGSTRSGESGKRKLPEIIQDSVLPRGTIEIPLVKPKTPCHNEKRRKIEKSKSDISEKRKSTEKSNFSLSNNSQTLPNGGSTSLSQPQPGQFNFFYKSCEVKLSRELKFPSSQPSIGTNFNATSVEKTNCYWDDAFNNNRPAAPISDNDLLKSNDDPRPYSDSRLSSSPLSNVTDEAKALSDLLSKSNPVMDYSFIDIFHGDKNLDDSPVSQNDLTISSEPKGQEKVKPLEKLTSKNLNRFNNLIEPLAGQLKTTLQKLETATGQGSGLESGDSEKSRKRKWISNESTTKSSSQKNKVNGKAALVRKHWKNEGKWILDKPGPSSMGFETHSSLSNEPRASGKLDKPVITDSALKRVRVETANRNINNNLEKSETVDDFLQKSDNKTIITNLPNFGEPAVNEATSDSSSSSSSSSSSCDSTSTGTGGSGSNPPATSGPRTIEEALEKEIAMKKSNCMKGFKIPRLSKKNEVPTSMEKTNSTEMPSKSQELPTRDSESLDKNINPRTIDSEAELSSKKINRPVISENVETGAEMTENCENSCNAGIELNTIQPIIVTGANDDPNNSEHSTEEDLEELCDAETLARKKNTAGSVGENEEEEGDDCISLDTESLCLSGITTPPLHALAKSSKPSGRQDRSQVIAAPPPPPPPPPPAAPEPYARMRSSNIGKFVAENVRECEESFETFKDNVVISETMFDGVLTEVAVNSVPQKPLEPPTVQRDLRTTLNSRTISRDIPALFRGQCFAWLRFGSCRVRITCRFLHSRGRKLENIQQYDLKNIQEILTYSASQGYSHFIELVLNEAMAKMSTCQIKSVYRHLCTTSALTIGQIESIIDGLRIRQLTSTDILEALTESVAPEDTETRSKIQLAMYKKIEPENCWNVLAKLIIQIKPPLPLIQTIMEETVRKNCRQQARAIYDKVLQRMTVEEVKRIPQNVWDKFKRLTFPDGSCTPIDSIYRVEPKTDFDDGGFRYISPESPKSERVSTPFDDLSIKSPSIEPPIPRRINPDWPPRSTISRTSQSRSSSDFEDTSYSLQPIDKLPPPKCPYRDYLWKFHWDLQGMQEGLKHKDYAHVISILKHYAAYPNRLPHIQGFYDILIKEITSARHHLDEIIRLTVQSGSSDQLRLYVYDLGIYVVTKLADSGAWIHAYELLKTFQLYGSYNTCAFTLLAAQIYIANRRPSKALDLLEKSRLVCTNGRKWRQIQCKEDEDLRVTVLDLLLYSLCDGYADDALRLLDFILRDQCSTFKPINLIPHVDRIVRLILSGKHRNLVVDVGRLILQAKLFVAAETFRSLINHVFHDDLVLAKQLHRYATWLGTYNRAKINTASCVHMIININWTEEETFLMISSLMDELFINIGHAIDRIKIRQLNIFLIFEVIPSEKELNTDVSSDGLLSITAINKRRATVKSVLERFDPKIKMIQRYQGRICKLQSQSVIAYLKSGHVTL